MSIKATSDLLALINSAAAGVKVVSGERSLKSSQAAEPARPYFRVQFMRLGGQTEVPGRLRGVAHISCFGKDGVDAWAAAGDLTEALRLNRRGIQVPSHPSPSAVADYEPAGDGWQRGQDPSGGALVYTSIVFHYHETGA